MEQLSIDLKLDGEEAQAISEAVSFNLDNDLPLALLETLTQNYMLDIRRSSKVPSLGQIKELSLIVQRIGQAKTEQAKRRALQRDLEGDKPKEESRLYLPLGFTKGELGEAP